MQYLKDVNTMVINSLDSKLARIKKLDRLDGSEVDFEETMDRLDYFINLHYR